MKSTMKLVFGAAVLFAVGTLAAQGVYAKAANFEKSTAIKDGNGTIAVTGCTLVNSSDLFTIDPAKTYTINFDAKANGLKGNDTCWVLSGFRVFDKKGIEIGSWNVAAINGSDTVLAAATKKGDTFALVKDASKWKFQTSYCMVYNTKADKSDLPNRNLLGDIKKVEKAGANWKITFARPINAVLKAGTPVRVHAHGGYLYTAGSKYIKGSWVHFNGSIKGNSKSGWGSRQWPAGSVKAKLVILSNWNRKAASVELKNVSVTKK